MKDIKNKIEGTISISVKGTGYVKVIDRKEDIEIDFKNLNTALHGDTVEVILYPKAKISRIIKRAKTRFAGVLEKEKERFFLKPDDTKIYTDILIAEKDLHGALLGEKVFVEIVSWVDPTKAPEGRVLKILGKPGDNDVEMHSIAIEKGFAAELPKKVEEEAKKINVSGIKATDYTGRRDFRKTLTFTIDPYDAKDFDDAISFRILNSPLEEYPQGEVEKTSTPANGHPSRGELYEIGIHIADVSYYVKPGTDLDREARERGTSVYLVDRTIPMLPEQLSNDLCSLVPNKDRLTMSAVFIMDKNARVKEEWYGRTVIHSAKRFTYEEAEKSIEDPKATLHAELAILNNLAKKLTTERFASGAISLDQEEVKFVLDEKGVPIKVIRKERGDSNRLIEEFMLLANRKVAELLSPKTVAGKKHLEKESFSLYRIHDLPSKEKMADLAFFLRGLGYKIKMVDGLIPSYEINRLLKEISEKDKEGTMSDTVHRAVVRSMAKAIYSTQNIGHYGLAFKYYTHFTSPIRRYPDIIVHRLLMDYLNKNEFAKDKFKERLREYEIIARVSSEQEKRAADAERASIKYKQVEYMSKRIGQVFSGVISGLTEWGMYVEEEETKCEGLIRLRDLTDDYYAFNEKKLELVGEKKHKRYRFGDRIKVKVRGVDLERKTIDYVLV